MGPEKPGSVRDDQIAAVSSLSDPRCHDGEVEELMRLWDALFAAARRIDDPVVMLSQQRAFQIQEAIGRVHFAKPMLAFPTAIAIAVEVVCRSR